MRQLKIPAKGVILAGSPLSPGFFLFGLCCPFVLSIGVFLGSQAATTVLCLVDMTAFFDMLLPDVVVTQLFSEGIGALVLQYLRQLFNNVSCEMRTKHGVSRPVHINPGFRQGGRFSTTAGKAMIRRLMNKLRPLIPGVSWGPERSKVTDQEWADDLILFIESLPEI